MKKQRKDVTVGQTGMNIPLYERRKGKTMHASGQWETTKGERRIIEGFGYLGFFGIFAGLILTFLWPGPVAHVVLGLGILGMVGVFISLFTIVLLKNKKEPMEKHYYDVDYTYNRFKGEVRDNTREITKEEFLGKKADQ